MAKKRTFGDLVKDWKNQGYEVHVTAGFLEDLEELEKPRRLTISSFFPLPFEFAEDLLSYLPRNRLTKWLSSWMATLAIYANRPLFHRLINRKQHHVSTYRIA